MTISMAADIPESKLSPLLHDSGGGGSGGNVGHMCRPIDRTKFGGWRSAIFIMGVELAERFAFYGISSNLITYLTGPLGQSKAAAAENVNTWYGVASLLPLLGAFVADSYLGRYRTTVIASLLYILGLSLLTFSAFLTSLSSPDCKNGVNMITCSPSQFQVMLFFFSLYIVAVAQGGHKPCVQAFGADQFDGEDPKETRAKSSFFNWWYLGLVGGSTAASLVLNYIQDNLNWALGFGIPCVSMLIALLVFLKGTRTYRYTTIRSHDMNPFCRIGKVFAIAAWNWRATDSLILSNMEAQGTQRPESSKHHKFLDKALFMQVGSHGEWGECTISDVEDAKAVLNVLPISISCLVYAMTFSQPFTFFTEQASTMDRTVWPGFEIPPASLQLFISFSLIILIPIYDCFFVPFARSITGKPSGISMLQRIGIGMFASVLCMIVAAMVEMKRLETAKESGLVDKPKETIPMSFWWLVPQYLLVGIADVFTTIGLQEFFYDQAPSELKSAGLSLYLAIIGVGNLLSGFLISIVETTTRNGQDSWISDNLNRAHLDYFYFLFAGLGTVALVSYLYFAKSYTYRC